MPKVILNLDLKSDNSNHWTQQVHPIYKKLCTEVLRLMKVCLQCCCCCCCCHRRRHHRHHQYITSSMERPPCCCCHRCRHRNHCRHCHRCRHIQHITVAVERHHYSRSDSVSQRPAVWHKVSKCFKRKKEIKDTILSKKRTARLRRMTSLETDATCTNASCTQGVANLLLYRSR